MATQNELNEINSNQSYNNSNVTPNSVNSNKRKAYKRSSPIWQYCSSICINGIAYIKCSGCSQKFRWLNSTTNMMQHIKTSHPDYALNLIDEDEEENLDPELERNIDYKRMRTTKLDELVTEFIISSSSPFAIVENPAFIKLIKYMEKSYKLPSKYIVANKLLSQVYKKTHDQIISKLEFIENVSISIDLWTSCQNYPYLGLAVHFIDKECNFKTLTLAVKHLPGSHTTEAIANGVIEILTEWQLIDKFYGLVSDNAANVCKISDTLNNKLNKHPNNKIIQIGCCAHILNLIMQKINKKFSFNDDDILNNLQTQQEQDDHEIINFDYEIHFETFHKIIKKCKRIAAYFHQSTVLCEVLTQKQNELKLPNHKIIQDVKTRWNSTYLMIARILEQTKAINLTLMDNRVNTNNKYNDVRISLADFKVINDIANVFGSFYDATLQFSQTKYVTISKTIPIFNALFTQLEPEVNDNEFKLFLKSTIKDCSEYYYLKYLEPHKQLFLTATFLDLRSKLYGGVSEKVKKENNEQAILYIKNLINNAPYETSKYATTVPNTTTSTQPQTQAATQNTFSEIDDQYNYDFDTFLEERQPLIYHDKRSIAQKPNNNQTRQNRRKNKTLLDLEIEKYLNEDSITQDPSEFWKVNSQIYPSLFYCFKKIFCMPASSVPCEQLFSHTGYNVWDRRNKLSPENVNKIMIIYDNYRALTL